MLLFRRNRLVSGPATIIFLFRRHDPMVAVYRASRHRGFRLGTSVGILNESESDDGSERDSKIVVRSTVEVDFVTHLEAEAYWPE